jgi:dTMP kinase
MYEALSFGETPRKMANGRFIVLEGIDGAGTTTHTTRLSSFLRDQGIAVHATREPTDGPIGVLLRQILTGRLVTPSVGGGHTPPRWNTMGLLFAADRIDHLDVEIVPRLTRGITVISDRYDYSSIAYQSLSASAEPDATVWLRRVNRFARRPDLTIVLDVPEAVARERRKARSGREEIFDDDAFQARLGDFYANVEQHFPDDRIVHISADRPLADVATEIRALVLSTIGGR